MCMLNFILYRNLRIVILAETGDNVLKRIGMETELYLAAWNRIKVKINSKM